jgi:hypothetical protein
MSGFVDLASFGHKCCLGCGEGSLQVISEVGGGTAAPLDDCQGIVGHRLDVARQVLVLSVIRSTILTPVLICPISSSVSQLSSEASNRSVQNCLSVSWRIPYRIQKSIS